jgi:preprotein translocase subunit Sec61beta
MFLHAAQYLFPFVVLENLCSLDQERPVYQFLPAILSTHSVRHTYVGVVSRSYNSLELQTGLFRFHGHVESPAINMEPRSIVTAGDSIKILQKPLLEIFVA